jgi:hypothetical protein
MRKIVIYSLVGFLVLVMASVAVRMGIWEILIKRLKMDNVVTKIVYGPFITDDMPEETESDHDTQIPFDAVPFDAKEEWPFTKNKPMLIDTSVVITEDARMEEFDTNTVVGKVKKHIDFFLKYRSLLPYDFTVKLAQMYESDLNWYINKNAILVSKNYWVSPYPNININQIITSINDFNLFLKMKNIPLLYVGIPDKISPDSIYYFVDSRNSDKDSIFEKLRRYDISVLDLRENIRNENKDWHSLFFNTDHHWKAESGLWGSKVIAEKLNSAFDFDLDATLLNTQKYNYKIYKDWFLGALSRNVGHYLAKPDDFTIITPNIKTSFDILQFTSDYCYAKKEDVNFDSAFIYPSHVNKKDYYNFNTYLSYMNNNYSALIQNKLNSNGQKLLIIGESNTLVLVPFLSVLFEYVVKIDLRMFGGSLEAIVERENPDIVIIAYNYLNSWKLFDFR